MRNNGLILFTNEFPYGIQESFLETEIEFLSKYFGRIVIFPVHPGGTVRRIPQNTEIVAVDQKATLNVISVLKWYLKGAFSEKRIWPYLYHIFTYFSYLRREIKMANQLSTFLDRNAEFEWSAYSYWFLEGCLAISVLRARKFFVHAVSRAHGYDLYDFRQGGHIPFRSLKMKYLDNLVTISENGLRYMLYNTRYKQKVILSRLGTTDHGPGIFKISEQFRIVSCSNIIPLKRVDLIAKAIFQTNESIIWHHFGDGQCMDQLRELVAEAPLNVEINLMGRVSNREILKFYKNESVNIFINLSETEGIPVSIMEAISFGIPILALDVGGNAEIVTNDTGILMPATSPLNKISETLGAFFYSFRNGPEFRKKVRQYWMDHFSAERNYEEFLTSIFPRR